MKMEKVSLLDIRLSLFILISDDGANVIYRVTYQKLLIG